MSDVALRKAEARDLDFFYDLSCDAEVRKNSLNTSVIDYQDHVVWFWDRLFRKDYLMFVVCADGASVGQVRVQIVEGVGTVSYSIQNKSRGNNYGQSALEKLEKELTSYPTVRQICGVVKYENTTSANIFLKLGYFRENLSDYILFKKEL